MAFLLQLSRCYDYRHGLPKLVKCLISLEFYFLMWNKIYEIKNISSHSSLTVTNYSIPFVKKNLLLFTGLKCLLLSGMTSST